MLRVSKSKATKIEVNADVLNTKSEQATAAMPRDKKSLTVGILGGSGVVGW